jgi:HSP20 family molecular chaperone IbpA
MKCDACLTMFFGDSKLAATERIYAPLIDLQETDNQYILEADLPGFNKEDIKIDLTAENIENISRS